MHTWVAPMTNTYKGIVRRMLCVIQMALHKSCWRRVHCMLCEAQPILVQPPTIYVMPEQVCVRTPLLVYCVFVCLICSSIFLGKRSRRPVHLHDMLLRVVFVMKLPHWPTFMDLQLFQVHISCTKMFVSVIGVQHSQKKPNICSTRRTQSNMSGARGF